MLLSSTDEVRCSSGRAAFSRARVERLRAQRYGLCRHLRRDLDLLYELYLEEIPGFVSTRWRATVNRCSACRPS